RSELEERLVAVRTREAELERALDAVRAEEALLRARREELSAQELSQERELSALREELVRGHTLYDRGKVDVVERLAAVQARESELDAARTALEAARAALASRELRQQHELAAVREKLAREQSVLEHEQK